MNPRWAGDTHRARIGSMPRRTAFDRMRLSKLHTLIGRTLVNYLVVLADVRCRIRSLLGEKTQQGLIDIWHVALHPAHDEPECVPEYEVAVP